MRESFDLAVVGGGINGAGIARDAAGRGLAVLLCERDDLASHTSSASSKLIHGGLRYLEYREFRLVGKALAEREVLLRLAPHIVWPLRFVMPHVPTLRPAWLIRLGLLLYDHLDFGKRRLLPGSRAVRLSRHPAGEPLIPALTRGFEYSDAWVDDARLVVLNVLDAVERGAEVLTRTRCVSADRSPRSWRLRLQDRISGSERTVSARALVNATGPWVNDFLGGALGQKPRFAIRRIKGSHIVVPRLFDHGYAYIFQNPDRRIVFALPYESDFTLIGTTDVEHHGDPGEAAIEADEVRYLCDVVNRYFRRDIRPEEIVHSYSGMRPLLEDEQAEPSAVTRDYTLDLDMDGAPVLSVYGGKLTTYRKLAEEALAALRPRLGIQAGTWTAAEPLPGGDIEEARFDDFLRAFRSEHPWLSPDLAHRYARAYGTRARTLIGTAGSMAELGEDFGAGLHARELTYLVEHEWARTAEDVLWRRTKLGLRVRRDTLDKLERWFASWAAGPRNEAEATRTATP